MIAGPASILDTAFDCLTFMVRALSKLLQRKPPVTRKKSKRPSNKKTSPRSGSRLCPRCEPLEPNGRSRP